MREKIEEEAANIKELRASVHYPKAVIRFSKIYFAYPRFTTMNSTMFATITRLIDVVIRTDYVPSDTKITVKSDSPCAVQTEPVVVIHTFPVTPFVTIQIL